VQFRPLLAAGIVVAAAVGLTGCGAHDSTGRISVSISADAAERPYEVKVFDATHQLVEHQRVFPGGSADFAGVPLGKVTVRAGDLCPVKATVTFDAVATAKLAPGAC
jgi:hypothetical protein